MLELRLIQVALLPAIMTATMAYLTSDREGAELSRVMVWCISATIFGGMAGRVISGQLASVIAWERVALVWAELLLIVTPIPSRRATPKPPNLVNPDAQLIRPAMTSRGNALIYVSVLCIFWVFMGYLNYLPFCINELDVSASIGLIGQRYLGYSNGILSALTAGWLAGRVGGPIRAALIGFSVMIGSLMSALGDVWIMITQVLGMCLEMFVIHTLAASEVNHNARSLGGVVNGLYMYCYYAAGGLGAWLMGYMYELFGWTSLLVVISHIGMTGALCMWLFGRQWAAGR